MPPSEFHDLGGISAHPTDGSQSDSRDISANMTGSDRGGRRTGLLVEPVFDRFALSDADADFALT
jgi:hypothetical protein